MTDILLNLMELDIPFVFLKFGDGEYFCANSYNGANCDGDRYNYSLGSGLRESFKYFSDKKNAYLGAWHTNNVVSYFNSLTNNVPNWIHYHSIIMDSDSFKNDLKLRLFESVKNSARKKILISNELLIKAIPLFNIDTHIIVPYRNWFENNFNDIFNKVLNDCEDCENPLIITCAGMGSKVLVHKLHEKKPNAIYLDFGSGLDYLCTKKCSRGNTFSYDDLLNYFNTIIPDGWDDPKYNHIYEKAKTHIGIHL